MRLTSTMIASTLAATCMSLAFVLGACLGEDATLPSDTNVADAAPASATDAGSTTSPTEDAAPKPTADAADAGPTTFCATVPKPDGGQFFCADFDGANLGEGMKTTLPDAGTITRVTDLHYSPPASVALRGPATLTWEATGAQRVKSIDARVRVNPAALGGAVPATTGSIAILEVFTGDSHVSLRYTRGGTVESGTYTGFYVEGSTCPNACALMQKRILPSLPFNVWTDVRLSWDLTDGATVVTFDGAPAFNGTTVPSTSTKVTTQLGLEENASSPLVGQHAFDDLRVWVQRL